MDKFTNTTYNNQDLFALTIAYPFKFQVLKDRYFIFKYEEKVVCLSFFHFSNVLEIIEFDNGFKKVDHNTAYKCQFTKNIQQLQDNQIIVYETPEKTVENIKFLFDTNNQNSYRMTKQKEYTHIMITFEAEEGINFLHFSKDVLTYFIKSYKYIMDDNKLKNIYDLKEDTPNIYSCFCNYDSQDNGTALDKKLSRRDRDFNFKLIEYPEDIFISTKNPTYCEIKEKQLNDYLAYDSKKNWHDVILKAKEFLYEYEEYNLSILESFIALEFFILNYLYEQKLAKGISKNKLKEYKTEVSISYMLNIELPMFIEDLDQNKRQLLGEVDKVRKYRNDIVHNGKKVSKKDAEFSISAVEKLFILLEKI